MSRQQDHSMNDGCIALGNKKKCSPCQDDCAVDRSNAPEKKMKGSPCQDDCAVDGSIASRKGSPCKDDCAVHGSIVSCADINGSPCHDHNSSLSAQAEGYSVVELPEDIWSHIHSLMPFRYAAQAACISRAFLRSWRCYPNLVFSTWSLGLSGSTYRDNRTSRAYTRRVKHILERHLGVGVKAFKIYCAPAFNAKYHHYLDRWLQMAVTPGIEELGLAVCSKSDNDRYEFPCSVLPHGNGDLIRILALNNCTFSPTVGLYCFRSLTRLCLSSVHITGDELGCLLSNCFALEQLLLSCCSKIRYLNIPCLLLRLSYLEVYNCTNLQVVKSKAPNISRLRFSGECTVKLSLEEAVNNLYIQCSSDALRFACCEVLSSMPNIESLSIHSASERVDTPILCSKLLHLKYLEISLPCVTDSYDYLSITSFLDASPCLESFLLTTSKRFILPDFSDSWELRQMAAEHKRYEKLRTVKICPLVPAKSIVELTCHIVAAATSLECLELETKCSAPPFYCGECGSGMALETYIRPKLPSSVNLNVTKSCHKVLWPAL